MAGKLYTPVRMPGLGSLLLRFGFVAALILFASVGIYLEKGVIDSRTGTHPAFLDCLYFTMITITTVGYGDIVPITTQARLIDAFLLTPLRLIVIMTFLGTAYQMHIKRFQEEYRMKRAVGKLEDHIILCGCGATGRAAIKELLLQGTPAEQIALLDVSEDALEEAAKLGITAVHGDATREEVLCSVAIDRAAHVLVCVGRDDTAVLITLTAHDLNKDAQLIVSCTEAENIKLLERSGAQTIISPASAGGNIMAAATRRAHLADTMVDILSVGGSLRLSERPVRGDEVGKQPAALSESAILRVYRGEEHFNVPNLPVLQQDDMLVCISKGKE